MIPVNAGVGGWDTVAVQSIQSNIQEVLQTGQLSLGRFTKSVEARWPMEGKGMNGTGKSIVVANGTVGLELVWRTFDIDYLLVPQMTVPMVARSFLAAKGNVPGVPVLQVDVDDMLCMDLKATDDAIQGLLQKTSASKIGVCYVATGGLINPGFIAACVRWRSIGIVVVVDMSHAHGLTINGHGPYVYADAAVWSFYATKVLTCGEGGIVWFEDPGKHAKAELYANQGKVRNSNGTFIGRDGANLRLSEFAAAILDHETLYARTIYQKRRAVAKAYDDMGIPGLHQLAPSIESSFYKYVVPVAATRYDENGADDLEKAFLEQGVQCTGRVHSFKDNFGRPWSGPKSKHWARNHICLPVGRAMTTYQLEEVRKAWGTLKR